jgi:hypothetical protein
MKTLKERIAHRFLEFLSHYTPLPQAQLATLGGQGIEARVWAEVGIPGNHGWQIELNRSRRKELISNGSNGKYRSHNRLGTFHKILEGHGDQGAIDGFHLDLCGTLSDQVIKDFSPVLPLVYASKGRSLAITLSDSRRNAILENWPEYVERGIKLFGKHSQKVFEHIVSWQKRIPKGEKRRLPRIKNFDPEKGAKREFGVLVDMSEIIGKHWTCTSIERYVYVSRYSGYPVRMRTYFFHFEPHPKKVPNSLVKVWLESPLFFDKDTKFVAVRKSSKFTYAVKAAKPRGEVMKDEKQTGSKLEALVRLVGGEAENEYNALVDIQSRYQDIFRAIGVASPQVSVPQFADKALPNGGSRSTRRKWQNFSDEEQVEWLVKILRRKSQNNGKWPAEWKQIVKEDFGYYDTNLARALRSSLAHTTRSRRPKFIARIKEVFGDKAHIYIDQLPKG